MNRLIVNRAAFLPDCTIGQCRIGPKTIYTLEPPWRNNEHDVSCIPEGEYDITLVTSPTKGRVVLLHNVPGREAIEMHTGNEPHETKGCFLVGLESTFQNSSARVDYSASAKAYLTGYIETYDIGKLLVINGFRPTTWPPVLG